MSFFPYILINMSLWVPRGLTSGLKSYGHYNWVTWIFQTACKLYFFSQTYWMKIVVFLTKEQWQGQTQNQSRDDQHPNSDKWMLEIAIIRDVTFHGFRGFFRQQIFSKTNFPKLIFRHQIFSSKFSDTKIADKRIFRNHIFRQQIFRKTYFPTIKIIIN